MTASDISEPQRLSLTLDPGVVLERLILRHLSGLQRKRGQAWLRSLLVQGFLVEGQWLRSGGLGDRGSAPPRAPSIPATSFASWLECAHAPALRVETAPPAPASPSRASAGGTAQTKPFAHLRKVIG